MESRSRQERRLRTDHLDVRRPRSGGINNATAEQTYGITFDSLDPFNEPNTNYWGTTIPQGATWPSSASRQEGAHIGPQRQDQMIQALAARLAAPGTTTKVPISAMDETNPSTFVTDWNGWSQPSKDAVAQLNVHTYGTSDRTMVRDIAKTADKPLWMSEVEGDWDTSKAGFNQTNIDNGLGIVDFDCNADGNSKRRLADGDADPSRMVVTNAKYNTVRNFTHFIRPGDHIVPTNDTQTTAAVTASGTGVNLVHVNTETTARTVRLDLSNFASLAPGATVTPVVTTQSPADDVEKNALVRGSAVAASAPQVKDGALYQLLGVHSGKALTVQGTALTIRSAATTADAATAQTWTATSLTGAGSDRQRVLLRAADGRYLASSGTNLTVISATPEQAAANPAAQWIPATLDGRGFSLLNVAATRVLDVNGAGTADGTSVGLWTSNNGANQAWTLAPTAVQSVPDVTVTTAAGVAPVLPATVPIRYVGGGTRTAAVTWSLDGHDWAPGTTIVAGSGTDLFGTPFTVRAVVDVGAYTAALPVSLTTHTGASAGTVAAVAPTTVPLEVRAGGATASAPVTWSWSGVTDAAFAQPGIVSISGSASVAGGGTLPATLSVIVTVPREDNAADTLTYPLSAAVPVPHVKVYFKRDGGTSWARTMHVDYRLGSGPRVTGDTITVGTPATGDPSVDVPVGAASADQIRVVMNAYPNTHLIVRMRRSRSSSPPTRGAMVRVTAVSGAQKVYTVAVARDVVVSGVTITGTPTVGASLTAVAGTVDPSTAQVTYAWRRDGVPISGAVSAQYTVTTADVGHALSVALTASADGFTAATAVSDAVTGQDAPTTPTPSPSGSASPSPSAPAGPGAPGEDDLTAALQGAISGPATITAGSTVSIQVGTDRAGSSVGAWLFSTPRALGTATVSAAGTIAVTVPTDAPAGAHRLAVTDASGAVIGCYAVTVTAAPTALATTGATAPFGVALAIAMLLVLAGAALVLRRRPARG
ncbi:hypothetical protein HMPREF1529_01311 [Microbacterium sp. oral taxon 186 str. F0373]|uniref:RICIN domain-containing protein n=1 Tax=Microbacterium sp. oral taxon 186 TaxID=712383 RepID=UPI00034E825E|nr:RICIN domain-containing protein [Microbacterium sp. oral taxon 186]EPD84708.1 hypothetical protein HMPREF1529_01311 [Microbacterium sp. oral taxon 186 str. F0373]